MFFYVKPCLWYKLNVEYSNKFFIERLNNHMHYSNDKSYYLFLAYFMSSSLFNLYTNDYPKYEKTETRKILSNSQSPS